LSYASRSDPSRKPFNIPNRTTRSRQMSKEKTSIVVDRDRPLSESFIRADGVWLLLGVWRLSPPRDYDRRAANGRFWKNSESKTSQSGSESLNHPPKPRPTHSGHFTRNVEGTF